MGRFWAGSGAGSGACWSSQACDWRERPSETMTPIQARTASRAASVARMKSTPVLKLLSRKLPCVQEGCWSRAQTQPACG